MCTAAYIDRAFRNTILRDVYCQNSRWVAPSYGFDLVVVLIHAWRAWILEVTQYLIVLAIFAIAAYENYFPALLAVAALAIWYCAHQLIRIASQILAYYRGRKTYNEFEALKSRGNLLGRMLLASCIIFVGMIGWRWHASASQVNHAQSWLVRTGVGGAAVVLAALIGDRVAIGVARQLLLNLLRRHDAPPISRSRGRLSTIGRQQEHPFTIYSGFRPFIGSGINIWAWSFAQRLVHHKPTGIELDEEHEEQPFFTEELVRHLQARIESLDDPSNVETHLPGLTVTHDVFLEGVYATEHRAALGEFGNSSYLRNVVGNIIANSGDIARHYLACQVVSWGGEVVTTVFVHASLQGRTLYLEFSTQALLPTRDEYHVIDEVGGTGPVAVIKAAGRSVTEVSDAVAAPGRLAEALGQLAAALRAQRDGTLKVRRGVNIGATFSARQYVAAGSDQSYFQVCDILQHSKIIERRLIAAVGEFLQERDVDTSEFWQRATTILNKGVMHTGRGAINIYGSAIGEQARVDGGAAPPDGGATPSPG